MNYKKNLVPAAAMAMAGAIGPMAAVAATVVVNSGNSGINITSDPNDTIAIRFDNASLAVVSTSVITGDVTEGATGSANLDFNGTADMNGNLGSAADKIAYFSTGMSGTPARLADGNVYTFNGNIYAHNMILNNGTAGVPFDSTIVINGATNQVGSLFMRAPNTGKSVTLDLTDKVIEADRVEFDSSYGGTHHIISTIKAGGGQTSCTAGANSAGCISAIENGQTFFGPTYTMPDSLNVSMRVANGVTVANGTKYTIVDFDPGTEAVPTLTSGINSLTTGFTFVQDTTNTEDLVIMLTGAPAPLSMFTEFSGDVAYDAADVLDEQSANATDQGMIDAITALQGMDDATRSKQLRRAAPETGTALAHASNQAVDGTVSVVETRLGTLRDAGQTGMSSGDVMTGPKNTWVSLFGSRTEQDAEAGYAGYESGTRGIVLGADIRLSNDVLVGGAFTYATSDVDMDDFRTGDSTDVETFQVTGYANRDYGQWHWGALLGYSKQDYTTHRGTLVGTALGKFDGAHTFVRVELGKNIALGEKSSISPMVGLEFDNIKLDGYTETGAGAFSQTVHARSMDRLRSMLGAKYATVYENKNGMKIRPAVSLAWRRALKNDSMDTTAAFVGGGAAFTTEGQEAPKDTFNLGASVAFDHSDNMTIMLKADVSAGHGYRSLTGQAVAKWTF